MRDFHYDPPLAPLDILHRDAALLLVNKPAGLLSVPGKSPAHRDCLESRVKAAYPEALLVHRLDMDTSGLMVFAMTKPAQRHLGLQFDRRHLETT
jgi:tRNA pseudouridine32 synthase/23S rRNA pseudouridine746 synthase